MKIETELDAGNAGYFLIDDSVQLLNILEVKVTQSVRYVGSSPSAPAVEYLVTGSGNGYADRTGSTWVPAKRAARTKAELLAKL